MKILFVTLSNLGDVVMTLPVYQSLRRAYPDARIDVVVSPRAASVFREAAGEGRLIEYDKKMGWSKRLAFIGGLRRERYDLAVDLRFSPLGFWAGARRRNRYFLRPRRRARHRLVRHLQSLDGLVPASARGASFLDNRHAFPDRVPPVAAPYVVAAPGARSDVKRWPAESFAALLDKLWLDEGLTPVLVGSPDEREDARRVAEKTSAPVMNLCGETDFAGLVSVLRGAALAVTNDSAPLHVADALKIPVLALFGPTDARKYGPKNARGLALRRTLFCSPCEEAQCRYNRECLNELSVAEAHRAAKLLLTDSTRRGKPKILLIRLDRIGDLVLSFPAIAAVRRRHPEARLTLMVRPPLRALAEQNADVDEVIVYDYARGGRHSGIRGNLRFIREIAKHRFDAAFLLNPSVRSTLVPWAAGIPYRIGLRTRLAPFLTTSVPDRRHEGRKHEAEYTLDIVRAFGVRAESAPPPRLFVSATSRLAVEKNLAAEGLAPGEPIAAIHPGASCPSKRWPVESFEALGRRILEETGLRIVLIGGKEEKALGAQLASALGPRALDFTGGVPLAELGALLERCRILVSNDSGPVHIAAAVGTPVLSIFGRNRAGLSQTRWKPLGAAHASMQKDVGCAVCLAHLCPIGFECLRALSPEEVWAQFAAMTSPAVQEGLLEKK